MSTLNSIHLHIHCVFLGNAYFLAAVARGTPLILNDFTVDSLFSSGQLQQSSSTVDYDRDCEKGTKNRA
jgi:hypothetical protein